MAAWAALSQAEHLLDCSWVAQAQHDMLIYTADQVAGVLLPFPFTQTPWRQAAKCLAPFAPDPYTSHKLSVVQPHSICKWLVLAW